MPDAGLWDWTKMTWDMIAPHRPPKPEPERARTGASRRHASTGTGLSATPG